jgi:DNA (cytosine-5)-methyltransferase 1
MDYACGAVGLPACSVNAPHIRQRLFWVADAGREGRSRYRQDSAFSIAASPIESVNGDSFSEARRALDGDYSHLLLSNGLSVGVEQHAIKCYGNAIVPQVAAEFIKAYLAATDCKAGSSAHEDEAWFGIE